MSKLSPEAYAKNKQECLRQLHSIRGDRDTRSFQYGMHRALSTNELMDEVERDTELGHEIVRMHAHLQAKLKATEHIAHPNQRASFVLGLLIGGLLFAAILWKSREEGRG